MATALTALTAHLTARFTAALNLAGSMADTTTTSGAIRTALKVATPSSRAHEERKVSEECDPARIEAQNTTERGKTQARVEDKHTE